MAVGVSSALRCSVQKLFHHSFGGDCSSCIVSQVCICVNCAPCQHHAAEPLGCTCVSSGQRAFTSHAPGAPGADLLPLLLLLLLLLLLPLAAPASAVPLHVSCSRRS
jgi:hypothetical protein